jgi:molybdopterin synthase sulfur carrier subunit
VPVIVYIPGPLRAFSGGMRHVQIQSSPATLRDALEELWRICPGIRDRLVNEEGQLREHINIFVGKENVRYTGEFATPLGAEAEISILPAVSGGVREAVFSYHF